jgi:inhibitor of KinA sporulation pathway (predicted exonuclease)
MNTTITKNIAFFDAEFTALNEKDRGVQEMIQCALIVHQAEVSSDKKLINMSDDPIFVYKTFVKPVYNPKLSDYIKELTGIEQENVDTGKAFAETVDDIYKALKEHNVRSIIVWGPDRTLLKRNCDVLDCYNWHARTICRRFNDVSQILSDFCGYDVTISQHKACQLLHVQEFGELHDAYCDATNLSKIIKEFYGQICL